MFRGNELRAKTRHFTNIMETANFHQIFLRIKSGELTRERKPDQDF